MATHSITINPQASAGIISGPSDVCMGETITLVSGVPNGIWSANSAHATVAGGGVTGMSSGPVTIGYSVTNSCNGITVYHSVFVNPIPDAGIISGTDSVCAGDTITLRNTQPDGVWSSANSAVAVIGDDGKITGVAAGRDTISYSVTKAGCNNVVTYPITVRSAASCVEAPKNGTGCTGGGEISIYPNPLGDEGFTIDLHSGVSEDAQIVLYNAIGQKVRKFSATTNAPLLVDVNLVPGVYTLVAISAHGKCVEKVVR